MNTKILEKMVAMECMLSGEYIFDKTFLENSVSDMSILVYQVVYNLNAMTQNRYPELFDIFQDKKGYLEDVLAGGFGSPYTGKLTLPYSEIRMEMQPLVGLRNVGLAELGYRMGMNTPDGFVVTATGVDIFMRDNDIYPKIKEIVSGPWSSEKRDQISTLFKNAGIRDELELAISDAVRELLIKTGHDTHHLTVRAESIDVDTPIDTVSIGHEDSGHSANMYYASSGRIMEAFRQSLADCTANMAEYHPYQFQQQEISICVAVHAMLHPKISGMVITLDPSHPSSPSARVSLFPENDVPLNSGLFKGYPIREPSESLLVQRYYPFEPVSEHLPPGDPTANRHILSVPIQEEGLIILLESVMAAERTFGKPQKIYWAKEASGRILITGIEPLPAQNRAEISPKAVNEQLQKAVLLLKEGDTAQIGAVFGRVIHITENTAFNSFPLGAIAVARKASPHLSPLLRRAGGLITEAGSPVGHLAAIAREVRIPAIMGAKHALEVLKEGMLVTLDAGDCKVYQGILDLLVEYRLSSEDLYPSDPEYITLRQLIRGIVPLNMTDYESAGFKSGNCRTFHDIIHFAHEMAVEELLNIQARHKELKDVQTRRLAIDIPIDIRVLEIISHTPGSKGKDLQRSDITCLPLKSFLKGITMEGIWDQRPTSIGLKEIFSGMDRTHEAMAAHPEYSGQNLAIVTENYLNLTLRLGYHFNVINAYLCENQSKNFIYFRFVGGFARTDRRQRRVEFIAAILNHMDFKVFVSGDLLIGKLKMANRSHMESALICLGELTGFTRQLDLSMESEKDVEEFLRLFNQRAMNDTIVKG
ncbi:MAG: PEP-utilizing enzyme [Desulfobacula sp.]